LQDPQAGVGPVENMIDRAEPLGTQRSSHSGILLKAGELVNKKVPDTFSSAFSLRK
jgi:hypothetical protein